MSEKIYDVPAEWAKRAFVDDAKYKEMYARSVSDPERVLGRAGQAHRLDQAVHQGQEHLLRARQRLDQMVRGRRAQRLRQLPRPPPRRSAATRSRSSGKATIRASRSKITYRELHDEVCRLANVLRSRGVKKGDRVTIYLPMIPEAALRDAGLRAHRRDPFGRVRRLLAGQPRRPHRGLRSPRSSSPPTRACAAASKVPLKANADEALRQVPAASTAVIVVKRTGGDGRHEGRPRRLVSRGRRDGDRPIARCEPMDAEDPLFILYTSGSTGKPKGVLHTTGGYLVWASMTHQYVFDYHDGDIYWCTADVGWVTGHSYIVYGPLANGATTLMFEGVPNYPSNVALLGSGRQAQGQHLLHRADRDPRADARGDEPVKKTSRKSLRLLGSVGEPINPEAWHWYHRVVGDDRCPIVDTWWQTETGGILITPLPGATELKPGSATRPFFGVLPALVDADGKVLEGAMHRQSRASPSPGRARCARSTATTSASSQTYFSTYQGQVLHRRRLPPRRRRLLLDHRPRRRRHQRLRPPHGHRRSRKRAGGASEGGGSRRGRLSARHQGPGHLRLCHADGRRRADRGAAQGAGGLGAQGDRPDRLARPDPVRARPAEDPLRQDHAPHPAQDRRERVSTASATPRRWPIPAWSAIWSRTARTSATSEACGLHTLKK